MTRFSVPLHTGWTVEKNDTKEGLALQYHHREQKGRLQYQDYSLALCLQGEGAGHRLTLTVTPRIGGARLLETRFVRQDESLSEALSLLQGMTDPACWGAEHRAWIAGLWEAERQRLGTRHIRPLNPPRPPIPGRFVPLRVPAGWEAAWNTFDTDYLQPDFLAPAEDLSPLHWERDIAMFVKGEEPCALCLDLEDWSGEDMRTAAFRVHLYHWTEEGPETLGELMTREVWQAVKKMEEFFPWDCEAAQSRL